MPKFHYRLLNKTSINDALLRKIILFVHPRNLKSARIIVRRHNKPEQISGWASRKTAEIRISKQITFPHFTSESQFRYSLGYSVIKLNNYNECLVYVLGHEFRHLWQFSVSKKEWDDEYLAERDAESYAKKMIRKWRLNG